MDDVKPAVTAVDLRIDREVFRDVAQYIDHGSGNKAVSKIRCNYHIEFAGMLLEPVADLLFGLPQDRILVEKIDLKKFGQISIHKAPLRHRGRAFHVEKYRFYIFLQLRANELFLAVDRPQTTH